MMEHHGPDEHSPIEHAFDPVAHARRSRRPAMADWKHPRNGDLPPAGVTVETVDSGGHHQELVYDCGLWWFPDRSMYVYYTPQAWRLPEEAG